MSNLFNNRSVINKKVKNKSKYIVLAVLVLVSLFSVSYAVFTIQLKGEKKYSLTIGTLDFSINNEQNSIRLMNAYPMSDKEGQALRPYTFSLTNTGTLKQYYKVSLITDTKQQANCTGCNFLAPNKLRYSLTIDGVVGEAKNVSEDTTLDLGELANGQTKNYELRLWLRSEATIEEENKYYYGKIKVDASQEKIKETVIIAGVSFPLENSTPTFPDFTQISSVTNGRGIYKYQEDGQDIYYWRGKVTDNHVIFAGYCWEMVRTTKTGGVKMIYDGTPVDISGKRTCPNTGSASQLANKSAFNIHWQSPAGVGYMYGNTVYTYKTKSSTDASLTTAGILYGNDVEWTGTEYRLKAKPSGSLYSSTGTWNTDRTSIGNGNHYTCFNKEGKCAAVSYVYYTGDNKYPYYIDLSEGITIEKALEQMYRNEQPSTMKATIENWFETSMINTPENLKKLEDTIYCNDRSVADMTSNGWSKDGNAGNHMYYSAYTRLSAGKPDLNCKQTAGNRDRFTYKDTVNGNGMLKYPVGLLTADEINLAGGQDSSNSDYYLHTGEYYWGFSPYYYYASYASEFHVGYDGYLGNYRISEANGMRPVVSLVAGTELTGLGTEESPFEVK